MALVLIALFIGDHPRISRGSTRQQLLLDHAYNDDHTLRSHVESLVGGSIQSLTVLKTDLVNDTTTVEVRYSRTDLDATAPAQAAVERVATDRSENSVTAGVR